nr:DUF6064 family protein [uncultured Desulfobacter sp.]
MTAVFWQYMENYNRGIFPMQAVFLIIAAMLVASLYLGNGPVVNRLIKSYFAFIYIWFGVVLCIVFIPDEFIISNLIMGLIYLVIGVLFFLDIFNQKTVFTISRNPAIKWVTLFLIIFSFAFFPLINYLNGIPAARLPLVGSLFCPTSILALALFAGSAPDVDKKNLILLSCLSIYTGIVALILFKIYTDGVLMLAGLYGLFMLYIRRRGNTAFFSSFEKEV